MSVSSEIHYLTNEDLIENIKAFCSAYTKDSVKSQIDAMQLAVPSYWLQQMKRTHLMTLVQCYTMELPR